MITQKDIARKLGVSRSLVSRAITGSAGDIGASKETVRKIRKMAEECGYVQNAAALSLRGEGSMTIGVVVKDFADPFFGKMTGEIQALSKDRGFSVLLAGYSGNDESQPDIRSLQRYSPDAILVCGSHLCTSWLRPFISKGVPVVQIGAGNDVKGLSRVEMDEEFGISLLLDHLKKLGHRELGFVGAGTKTHLSREKLILNLARTTGMRLLPSHSVNEPGHGNAGYCCMEKLLRISVKKLPTAILCADDITALGALKALYEEGMLVPRHVSLTGIDDIPEASLFIPALTTVRSPVAEMVRTAFGIVTGGKGQIEKVKVRPELVMRETCLKIS